MARGTLPRSRGSRSSRWRGDGDEAGAALLLALVYIVAVSLIVGALADWAMNDLNNTTHFNSTSQLHTALSSVTDLAIQNIRYTPDPSSPTSNPTGLGTCWVPVGNPAVSQYQIDTYTVAVFCNTSTAFASEKTRTVTLYACLSTFATGSTPTPTQVSAAATNCQAAPLLTAVVVFDDYPAQGAPGQTQQCNLGLGQCGEGMTLVSWLW